MDGTKTILYQEHVDLGGKMADFAGWIMPLWYTSGQSEEHHATRQRCGLFDICHMGEFEITGAGSGDFVMSMLSNKVEKLKDGRAMYNFMLNEGGGVVDDCIIYRFGADRWMLVVNAGNIQGDFQWLGEHAPSDVTLRDVSAETAKIDLQGPAAPVLLASLTDEAVIRKMRFFRFAPEMKIGGMDVLVSRTGYTGEVGFELYTHVSNASSLWNLLLDSGKEHGIMPCGLGARDTLRTEAGLPLHGHELHPDRPAAGHPWEFAITDTHDFIGRDALEKVRAAGIREYVKGFTVEGRRKAMPGYTVMVDGREAGTVLSGVIAPSLGNTPIGFLSVDTDLEEGAAVQFTRGGKGTPLEGVIAETPHVGGTARNKMSSFFPEAG